MKLKTLIAGIYALIDQEPDALELEVYYATDDEGNDYNSLHFAPSLGLREGGEMLNLDEGG